VTVTVDPFWFGLVLGVVIGAVGLLSLLTAVARRSARIQREERDRAIAEMIAAEESRWEGSLDSARSRGDEKK
jgi:hypothetical protein